LRTDPGRKVCETPSQPISGHGEIGLLSQATERLEIWRIMVPGQPQNLISAKEKLDVVVHACHPSYGGKKD
jgi:hypothetical protein